MSLRIQIVTPEGTLLDKEADTVVLPTANGDTGILEGHIPLITQLKRGELVLETAGKEEHIAVDDGFAEVIGNHIAVLTEDAIDVDDIDLSAVEEAKKRAQAAYEEAKDNEIDPDELLKLDQKLQFLTMQELVKGGSNKS